MSLVLITRPEPAASVFASDLAKRGCACVISPVLHYKDISEALPDFATYSGLVFTSAAAVAALRRQIDQLPDLPVYAVGDATAEAALNAGFTRIETAEGDALSLATLLADKQPTGRLLHLSGLHIARDLASLLQNTSASLDRHVIYEAIEADQLSIEAVDALRNGDITDITFFSPRTAHIFGTLVQQHRLADTLSNIAALCLSAAVADSLNNLHFGNIRIAAEPTGDALLSLIET